MMLLPLAVRNVLRSYRRSVITISLTVIGLVAIIFNQGFTAGTNREMVKNATRYFAGDVQVHLEGYHDDPIPDFAMPDSAPILHAVHNGAGVAAASIRLEVKVLASRSDKSHGLTPVGAEPADEVQVTVPSGVIVAGQSLTAGVPGMLTGEMFAEALAARLGQNIVFVGQGYNGSISSGKCPVHGIFRSKIDDLDGYVVVIPLSTVWESLSASGGATTTALRLRERSRLEPVSAGLTECLEDRYEVVG